MRRVVGVDGVFLFGKQEKAKRDGDRAMVFLPGVLHPAMAGDNTNTGNGNGNSTNPSTSDTSRVDTTSFDNIMAAVNRMRSEASGGLVTSETGTARSNAETKQANKRQKLPERVRPPPGATPANNTLPPRVQRPDLPTSNTSLPAYTPAPRATTAPVRSTPLRQTERFQRPAVPEQRSTTPSASSNFQTFNQIQVARSQTGNPLLEYLNVYQSNSKIKDVDYVINSKCVALFLSLRYHKLHPEYIYNKLKKVTYDHEDTLRVLLLYVDVEDFQDTVRELDKLCLFNKLTLILAWTNEQCASYLQNLKYVEKETSKQIIQGNRTKDEDVIANDGKYLERVMDTVSSVKSVSQSDAKSLLIKYGSVRAIIEANAEELPNIQGLGQLKVDRLVRTFNGSFRESR